MKTKYDLVGIDGNAFSVMAYVKRAMQKEHFTKEEIDSYINEATSGDYDNLLALSFQKVEECNQKSSEKVRRVQVDWDTDGDDPDELGLPEEVDVPGDIDEDDITDWLSDEYGFCLFNWMYV